MMPKCNECKTKLKTEYCWGDASLCAKCFDRRVVTEAPPTEKKGRNDAGRAERVA